MDDEVNNEITGDESSFMFLSSWFSGVRGPQEDVKIRLGTGLKTFDVLKTFFGQID